MLIGRPWSVPANSSRYFGDRDEALAQPSATIQLAWDGHLLNAAFDASLIAHDDRYYTGVTDIAGAVQVPTLGYMDRIASHLEPGFRVVDIGCGQGELVEALRATGVDAIGFDPAVRRPTDHLTGRYWEPGDASADLFVMRCVLPHIADPWSFLAGIAESCPGAKVLIEFQTLEWICDRSIWYQLSHDHVNLFSVDDFTSRFTVVDSGAFADGEWGWVLVDPAGGWGGGRAEDSVVPAVESLLDTRTRVLRDAVDAGRPIAIWGAAGKGQVLCHALVRAGVSDVLAIDADRQRWGQHLELSGVEVIAPGAVVDRCADRAVWVANPNHLPSVTRFLAHAGLDGPVVAQHE